MIRLAQGRGMAGEDLYRRIVKRGVGAALGRSPVFRGLNLGRRYATSYIAGWLERGEYQAVDTFVAVVGHVKSGGTLLGSLLDAHPAIAMADELGAVRYLAQGFQRDQVCHLICKSARRAAAGGRVTARRLGGYALAVPGQWQGRHDRLQVVGDCRAGETTRLLYAQPALLDRMRERLRTRVRLVQVIRNPYDPIALMVLRSGRSLDSAIAHYFRGCDMLTDLRRRAGGDDPLVLRAVRYEDLCRAPEATLEAVCRWLGIQPSAEYLTACAAIVRPEPERSRQGIAWEPRWVRLVGERMAQYEFLQGYAFDD